MLGCCEPPRSPSFAALFHRHPCRELRQVLSIIWSQNTRKDNPLMIRLGTILAMRKDHSQSEQEDDARVVSGMTAMRGRLAGGTGGWAERAAGGRR